MASGQAVSEHRECPVTIGMATLNEERTVGPALDALVRAADTLGAEIVVVAGGADGTVEVVRSKLKNRERDKLLIDSEPRGKPSALNRLAECGTGQILVLTDGDVQVADGSIALLLESLNDSGVGCACARIAGSSADGNAVQRVCGLLTEIMHEERSLRNARDGSVDLASGNLMAVRRDLFPHLPLDANSDDGYISLYVRSKGKRIAYVENATAVVKFPSTLSDFLRQKVRTRYGHIQLKREFPDMVRRNASGEVMSFLRALKGGSSGQSSLGTVMLAIILTGCAWSCAHVRYRLPWLFRTPVWTPVVTTK